MNKAKKIAGLVLAVCVAVRTLPAYAQSGDEGAYSSMIPFKIFDPKGKAPENTVFTVKLAPVGNAPVPDVTRFEAKAEMDYMFGPIVFDEPGNYEYTISETGTSDDRIVLDERVYEVNVAVFVEDDGSMWGATSMHLRGTDLKEDAATFENDYNRLSPPDNDSSSQTDSSEEDSSGEESSDTDSSRGESSREDDSGDESSSQAEIPPVPVESSSSDGGGSGPPVYDSSGTDTSGSDSSDSTVTSGTSESTVSKTEESSGGSSSSQGTWIDTLTSPNTGGKVAMTLSGLMIAAAAVTLGRRRTRHTDDSSDGGGSS